MLINEADLRSHWHKTKASVITVPRGSVLTPSARDFLRGNRIRVQIEGEGFQDLDRQPMSTAKNAATVVAASAKPEHQTHLHGGQLVAKTHPVIAWRGQLDQFDCALVESQVQLVRYGHDALAAQLEEILRFAQRIMSAEVRETSFEFNTLLGWTPEQIREMSHHPDRYFGVTHSTMSYLDGPVVARLNILRAKVREVELYANRAFIDPQGNCLRTDIVQALNRLSSVLYILVCRTRSEVGREKKLPIGVSNRHVHLSPADLAILFGNGHCLTKWKDLSQPGQFAAVETVKIVGPKGFIDNVRVLGPVRKQTQVEISATDSFQLGVKPVVRDSGQLDGSEGVRLIGPNGSVELSSGVIVAARHIHMHPDQAIQWNLQDGQKVRVRIDSARPVYFEEVLIRVNPQFQGELHLDTDEANAAMVEKNSLAVIVGG
jgi:propanediol utilization protein/ethanolamine utilization cobalamin adenosyltransferase